MTENQLSTDRRELRMALERASSRLSEPHPNVVTWAYHGLLRAGINSLAQVEKQMNIGKERITSIRNIGKKSFRLIEEAVKITEEENKAKGAL